MVQMHMMIVNYGCWTCRSKPCANSFAPMFFLALLTSLYQNDLLLLFFMEPKLNGAPKPMNFASHPTSVLLTLNIYRIKAASFKTLSIKITSEIYSGTVSFFTVKSFFKMPYIIFKIADKKVPFEQYLRFHQNSLQSAYAKRLPVVFFFFHLFPTNRLLL